MFGSKGISGSTIKIIAMISMLVDHTAIVFVKGNPELYTMMRQWIGRMAFPIFCYLLVEGFLHTGNRFKYAGRLFLFALISEIPMDMALYGGFPDWKHQNVLFTLLLGLLMLWGMELAQKKLKNVWMQWLAQGILFAAVALLAQVTYCSYQWKGIFAIASLYLFRKIKSEQIIAGCVAFCWEPTALLAFVPIALYNGKRGLKLKYIFYLFYPAHLVMLYLLALLFQ